MADFVDVYKKLEENVLFHTKLEKIKYEDGKLFLTITPLSQRFLLLGDSVKVGYMTMLLPGRVVGKGENLIINLFYAGEGKWGDRSKPKVPVQKDLNFTVLIKFEGIYRAFEPVDISEAGLSLITLDDSIIPMMLGIFHYCKAWYRNKYFFSFYFKTYSFCRKFYLFGGKIFITEG